MRPTDVGIEAECRSLIVDTLATHAALPAPKARLRAKVAWTNPKLGRWMKPIARALAQSPQRFPACAPFRQGPRLIRMARLKERA